MKQLPLTPNGKIDTARLPAPEPEKRTPNGVPADALECQLKKIWEELLEISPVGTLENFFDLGGHSLMAASLFARISQMIGCNLPLAALLQAPTIAQLAALIRQGGWESFWSALVPIQPLGDKPPLFLIHPVGGNVLGYRTLTEHLPPDQPVFGLQALGLNGTEKPLHSVEAMASHYLREIRALRPHGPYLLAGYSSGGIVAYEMARQLRALSEPVPLLILLDTAPFRLTIKPVHVRLIGHLQVLAELPWCEKFRYLAGKLTLVGQKLRCRCTHLAHSLRPPKPGAVSQQSVLNEVRAINRRAILKYTPQPYPGPVALFRALQRQRFYERFQDEPAQTWEALVGDKLIIREIACDHGQVLGKTTVPQLAKELKALLDEVETQARR